jgi:hypothetical protein
MDNLLIVDVPEGAKDFEVGDRMTLYYQLHGWQFISIPPGNWTIVEQTEEEAAKIVKKYHTLERYADYSKYEDHDMCAMHLPTVDTALASLHSWIRSQGKEPKTSIILKKEI